MTDVVRRLLGAEIGIAQPTQLPIVPGIAELTAAAQQAHNNVEAAVETGVLQALEAGAALTKIKDLLPHGSFEDFVAEHFRFTIRTAQSYMRLTKQDDKVRQLLEAKANLGSHLTMKEALKYLNSLSSKKRR